MESARVRFLFTSCAVSKNERASLRASEFFDTKQRVNKNCTKHFPCCILFILIICKFANVLGSYITQSERCRQCMLFNGCSTTVCSKLLLNQAMKRQVDSSRIEYSLLCHSVVLLPCLCSLFQLFLFRFALFSSNNTDTRLLLFHSMTKLPSPRAQRRKPFKCSEKILFVQSDLWTTFFHGEKTSFVSVIGWNQWMNENLLNIFSVSISQYVYNKT